MRGRGRGRRGRGQGGRHGGRGRGGRRGNQDSHQNSDVKGADNTCVELGDDVKSLFTGSSTFEQHFNTQENDFDRYVATISVLMENGVALSNSAKTNILAVAWARHDHNLTTVLLDTKDQFKFTEVFKALTLLDSGRMSRIWERQMKRLQLQPTKPKAQTMAKVKKNLNNTTALKTKMGSASGALCRHIQRWVRKFTAEDLEFFALHFPTDAWCKLADICHFSPKRDFPNLPWFLPYCFGEPAPEGTIVAQCKNINKDNVNELVQSYDLPFLKVRDFRNSLTLESKSRIATYTKSVNTLLWYYEDLACKEVDDIISQRLESGEEVTLTYGKLVERIMLLKNRCRRETPDGHFVKYLLPLATVSNIKLSLEPPVVVIGDKSSSMQVAIRTSTIIASLLTAVTQAKLVFFNGTNHDTPFIPKDIDQVMELAMTTKAEGCTSPAASLLPFYTSKEVVKTFVIVTDEEENTNADNGMRFAELYTHYHDEVYPARLVFVSFLRSQSSKGQMVAELQAMKFEPLQFKFDGKLPDLTKLDNLLGVLATDSQSFEEQVEMKTKALATEGLGKLFEGIEAKNQRI